MPDNTVWPRQKMPRFVHVGSRSIATQQTISMMMMTFSSTFTPGTERKLRRTNQFRHILLTIQVKSLHKKNSVLTLAARVFYYAREYSPHRTTLVLDFRQPPEVHCDSITPLPSKKGRHQSILSSLKRRRYRKPVIYFHFYPQFLYMEEDPKTLPEFRHHFWRRRHIANKIVLAPRKKLLLRRMLKVRQRGRN